MAFTIGEYEQALTYHQRHLAIAQSLAHKQNLLHALGNLGNVFSTLSQYAQAADYYHQQLTIAREIGDRHREGQALSNLGNTYRAVGDRTRDTYSR